MTIDDAMQTGLRFHQAGRLAEAGEWYRFVLQQAPDYPDALHLLGMLATRGGQLESAENLIRRAIAGNPASADYHGNLGLVLAKLARPLEAIAEYQTAIALRPGFAQAYCNRGSALADLHQWESAAEAFQSAIEINPQLAAAHSSLGNALSQLREFDQAIAAARAAVVIHPESDDLSYNLGNVLHSAGRLDDAAAAFSRATEINPRHLDALCGLGNVRRDQSRRDEAIAVYLRAIEINPNYAQAHWNLSLTYLLLGDFERGWAEHEWRMKCSTLSRPAEFTEPRWRGEPLADRTILLHAEQGLGDTLQFARYASVVAQAGAEVILQCQPELHRLLKNLAGASLVISQGDPLPTFDLHCPLMSLPFVLGTRLDSIPASIPYLFAEPSLAQIWRSRLGESSHRRVGLVWAGSTTHKNDHNRSITLATLAGLATIDGMEFHTLQKGPAAGQIPATPFAGRIIDHTSNLQDFADTAGLIANLDLVITVDTAVAHLAGGMGKPIWLLLPHDPDWRWLLHRTDSPWYPTMRLFRQSRAGDWSGVVEDVNTAICFHPPVQSSTRN